MAALRGGDAASALFAVSVWSMVVTARWAAWAVRWLWVLVVVDRVEWRRDLEKTVRGTPAVMEIVAARWRRS